MCEHAQWRKSSYSDNGANCVEVAFVVGGVAMRDSKDPAGPVLAVDRRRWSAFMRRLNE